MRPPTLECLLLQVFYVFHTSTMFAVTPFLSAVMAHFCVSIMSLCWSTTLVFHSVMSGLVVRQLAYSARLGVPNTGDCHPAADDVDRHVTSRPLEAGIQSHYTTTSLRRRL